MSATAIFIVQCDFPTCDRRIADDTAWEARERARAKGWETGRNMNSRDRCWAHKEVKP